MKKLYILLLSISLGGIAPILQGIGPEAQDHSEKDDQPKKRPFSWDDAKNVLNFPFILGTMVHELGHALTAKLLWDNPIDIHIGAFPWDGSKSYLFKKYGFTIYELKSGGFAMVKAPQSKSKEVAVMLAAGPLAGALFYGFLGKNIVDHFKNYKDGFGKPFIMMDVLSESTKLVFSSVMVFSAFHQILYGFTPLWGPMGDGYCIWQRLGISNKVLNKFVYSKYADQLS